MNKKILAVCLALVGTSAFAQSNTGSVTLTGSINDAVALSNPQATGVTGTMTPNATLTAFDITFDYGNINLIPAASLDANGFARLNFSFDMRSNANYVLAARAVQNGATASVAQNQLGFSVKAINLPANPAQVNLPRADTITALFDATASTNGIYDGVTDTVTYASSLADMTAAAPGPTIISGNRISNRGSLNSPNNYIQVATEFVFRPELFLPSGTFSHTVTFTASAVP